MVELEHASILRLYVYPATDSTVQKPYFTTSGSMSKCTGCNEPPPLPVNLLSNSSLKHKNMLLSLGLWGLTIGRSQWIIECVYTLCRKSLMKDPTHVSKETSFFLSHSCLIQKYYGAYNMIFFFKNKTKKTIINNCVKFNIMS